MPTNHIDSCCVPDEGADHDPDNDENHEDRDGEQTPVEDADREVVAKRERSRIDEIQADLPPEERRWKDDIVTWDSKDDPENPQNWSYSYKVIVTVLFGMITMCSTFASSIFSSASNDVSEQYGVSTEVTILGLSLFVLGYVPGPIFFAPLSEIYGRRPAVLIPMFVFICFSAATATAKDIQTIFITRFFGGVMASSPVVNVGGGLADMFNQKERGVAVVWYSLAVIAGPTLGPIIGSAVAEQPKFGWRWTEYLVVILTSTVISFNIMFLPETFAPALLSAKARRLRLKTGRWELHSRQEMQDFAIETFVEKNLTRPLRMIVLEPMVGVLTLYNSFAYGILYLLFGAVPIVYEEKRGWNPLVGSLPFLAVLVGTLTAAMVNIYYSSHVFAPYLEKHGGRAPPERRLPPMMLGAITFPVGFFLLGWTSDPSINWFPSVLGLAFIGMSFLLIFQAGINYLLDAYTKYAASAVAANTFMRSIFAAALPLVAQPLFHNLGINWACTLLGCISVLLAVVPFLFYIYGPKLRAMSKMAADDI
ncbi:MFS general substrate transporter [Stereum hirsutum FP-91666 SS1]|uniref:MFS general substrate transporter n=1 Tax=Stereum hirsutum (strain FP-91666) TaxID=721885 RepID=UPI000440F931|nr:MFS general substrate transporter [Stereum hirsutum FP-91666 SS1]EIM92287.1 MFS general substrate transporter [Stereum hirsutum FP-91666 SS1]